MTVLSSGGAHRVVVGNEVAPITWLGEVVDGTGLPADLGENLILVHAERRDERWLRVTKARFEAMVPPGEWEVWRRKRHTFRLGTRIGQVTIPTRSFRENVVLPGSTLKVEHDQPGRTPEMTLRLADGAVRRPDRWNSQTAEFFMVPAGSHTLELGGLARFAASHVEGQRGGSRLPVEIPTTGSSESRRVEIRFP